MKLLLSKRFQSDLENILIFYSQKSFEASENLNQRRERPRRYYFVFLLSSLAFISSAASRSSYAFLKALRAFSKRLEFLTLGLSA